MSKQFYEAPGIPQVTAPRGTKEWEAQVVAYNDWLDKCYAEAEQNQPLTGDVDEEAEYYGELERGFSQDRM